MPEEKAEVVAVVREWQPRHADPISTIHETIDGWGAGASRTERPVARDYADVEARVDRITKRVKARNVTVTETVTEWVEDDGKVEVVDGSGSGEPVVELDARPGPSGGKRKPRILGFFGPRKTKEAVDQAVAERSAGTAGEGSTLQPQCVALTDGGAQCRNSARDGSKYCSSHKGYQPRTAKGIAQRVEGEAWDPTDARTDAATVRSTDTRPRVRRAKDTSVAVRKAGKRPAARRATPRTRTVTRKAK